MGFLDLLFGKFAEHLPHKAGELYATPSGEGFVECRQIRRAVSFRQNLRRLRGIRGAVDPV